MKSARPASRSRTDPAPHLAAGRQAEALARRYLEAQGLRTLTRNFRTRCGELDLVMQDGPELVVVEIRYRREHKPIAPAESVGARKRARIARAAQRFLQCHPALSDQRVRFDVVGVAGPLAQPRVHWVRAAFDCSDAR